MIWSVYGYGYFSCDLCFTFQSHIFSAEVSTTQSTTLISRRSVMTILKLTITILMSYEETFGIVKLPINISITITSFVYPSKSERKRYVNVRYLVPTSGIKQSRPPNTNTNITNLYYNEIYFTISQYVV